jgi:hypothetical protein
MDKSKLVHPHGDLSGIDVVVDYLDDALRRLKRDLEGVDEACLHWKIDTQANSIALVLWHMGRLTDVFFHQLTLGKPPEETCWFRCGWADVTGYDPRGRGRGGWGTLNEYTPEEVANIPDFSKAQGLGFIQDVYTTLRDYLKSSSMGELTQAAPGFDGQFTRYQVLSMALMDNIRHLGEIRLIKSLWERSQ